MKHPLRSTFVIAATIGLLLASGVAVFAQGPRGGGPPPGPGYGMHHGGGGFGPMGGILRQLDLTDEQRDQIRDRIDQAMNGELGQLMQDHRDKQQQLRQLIHDPNADESAITAAVQNVTADAEALALARHRLAVSVFDVLTPDQRAQAQELLAQGPQRMQRRMHRGPALYDDPDEE